MITIDFTALRSSDAYTLMIGTGHATSVEGTRDVFVTTEEDDTDLFMPVRCTSGTVRFYNAGGAWNTLADISDDHTPVQLVTQGGGGVVWRGYINKGYVGTRKFYGYNEECEICVQCPLSELETEYYEPTDGTSTMLSIGAVIADILTDPFGDGNIGYTPPSGGTDAGMMMNSVYVYSGMFYKSFEDDNGQVANVPKYTRKQALEEMMKMICCSAHWTGTTVEIKEMQVVSSGGTTLAPNPADTESSETAVMPYKKVRVTANADAENNTTALQWPTTAITNWVRDNKAQAGQGLSIIRGTSSIKAINLLWGQIGDHWQGQDAFRNITDGEYDYLEQSPGFVENLIAAYEDLSNKDPNDAIRRSPSVWLNQCSTFDTNFQEGVSDANFAMFGITTKSNFFIQDAILCIKMRLTRDFYDKNFSGSVRLSIRIGSMYYKYATNSWEDNSNNSFFYAEFENGELKRNQAMNPYFEDYEGYGIRVDGLLSGKLELTIDAQNFPKDLICVDSFEVKAVRHTQDNSEKNTYTATGAKGNGSDDVDIICCSQRRSENAENFMYLKYADEYVVVTTMQFSDGHMRPEQWIAERRASLVSGKARSLVTLRQVGNVAPGRYTINGITGKIYETLSISHDWAENITEAHLVEVS